MYILGAPEMVCAVMHGIRLGEGEAGSGPHSDTLLTLEPKLLFFARSHLSLVVARRSLKTPAATRNQLSSSDSGIFTSSLGFRSSSFAPLNVSSRNKSPPSNTGYCASHAQRQVCCDRSLLANPERSVAAFTKHRFKEALS